jgi:hypothetical protein
MAPADELLRHIGEMLTDCRGIRRINLRDNEKRAASIHDDCDITGIVIAKLLVVSAAWLVISVLLAGVGALVRQGFGSRAVDDSDVFFDWWIGWGTTVAFLLAWHLVLAITAWAWFPVAVAGAFGAWMARNDWSRALQPVLQKRGSLVGVILLAWLAVAAFTLGPERQYDTGLYHLQSVRWSQAYQVLPGLANVETRFATNSTFFLFGALVETLQIGGRNLRLAAGILFLPLIVQGIVTLHASLSGQRKMDWRRWFQVLMVPIALWEAQQYSSSLSPDGVMFVLAVVLSAELLRILGRNDASGVETEANRDFRIFGIVLLAAIGTTVKVSFAVFGAAVVAVALWQWSKTATNRTTLPARILVPAILVAALWIVHSIILSGYVAYPFLVGSFPVDWKVPRSVIQLDRDWIYAWARSPRSDPRDVIGNHDWMGRWMADTVRNRDVIAAALTLILAGGLRVANRRSQRQATDPTPKKELTFLLPSLVAVAVWFVTAPAIRLTLGPLWVIAVGILALTAARTGYLSLAGRRASIIARAALTSVLAIACTIGLIESDSTAPSFQVKQITTLSGLTLNVPVNSDQCGDAPLPCSSKPPDERLELRQPGTYAKGFRVGYSRMNTPTGSVNDARK